MESLKVISFVMLIPSALMQSMSALCAQNVGGRQEDRPGRQCSQEWGSASAFGGFIFGVRFFRGCSPVVVFFLCGVYFVGGGGYID